MGAWGPGAFENDTALDFAAEIRTAQDLADALTIRTPDQPIDADTACRIVVVAECVAAMRGHPSDDMPRGLAERVATFGRPSKSLFHHARNHPSAAMLRSELRVRGFHLRRRWRRVMGIFDPSERGGGSGTVGSKKRTLS